MKTIRKYSIATLLVAILSLLGACSQYDPRGYEEVSGLDKVTGLKAEVANHVITVSWNAPTAPESTGVLLIRDGNIHNALTLGKDVTSHSFEGEPMGQAVLYTVKVLYKDNKVSEGVTVSAEVPAETLAEVTGLTSSVQGRTVTLNWTLPQGNVTGVRVLRDGEVIAEFDTPVTTCELKAQPMQDDMTYTVQAVYDTYYAAAGASVKASVAYVTPKMGYLLLASTVGQLPDDDERAAAEWFAAQDNAEFVTPAQLADIDADEYPVLWIEIDRVGLPLGWQNLPSEVSNDATIEALRRYSAAGGSLYLSNMATQLTVPLGIVPDNMAPTVYGNGEGGTGDDVWVINPFLGIDFKDGGDQGFYDRTAHAIYQGLTLEDPNGYGYLTLPLIGPGQREDHNCLWDCNIYGRGSYADVIRNFEVTTNSLVLATWGHVRDHCVAGLVAFNSSASHGRCVANGLAAYEWNQNSGPNPYQHNVEQLTLNILNYLK